MKIRIVSASRVKVVQNVKMIMRMRNLKRQRKETKKKTIYEGVAYLTKMGDCDEGMLEKARP